VLLEVRVTVTGPEGAAPRVSVAVPAEPSAMVAGATRDIGSESSSTTLIKTEREGNPVRVR
jgi:hypothetical protein